MSIKKMAAVICGVLLFCGSASPMQNGPSGTPPATNVTDMTTVYTQDGLPLHNVTDNNTASKLEITIDKTLAISGDVPFSYLYIIWDAPPPDWHLEPGGGPALLGGQNGFLHELVMLPAETDTAQLVIDGEAAILCDIYFFTDGELPGWVQRWQPPCEEADLLVLPTHADDEHLFFGGILPTYAGEKGLQVQVAYLTNHWNEPYRPHELLNGLWTVGVTAYPVMGPFPDLYASLEGLAAAETVYDREEVLAYQVELLRRFRPLVVVGHDLDGEYGHGAHILNAVTLAEAVGLSGDETQFPESAAAYGAWEPYKVYLHLYGENERYFDWDIPLARFGGATAYEMAVAGFAQHRSQQTYFSVQQEGSWEDCRRFGLLHTTLGPDVACDSLFENIPLPRTASSDASLLSEPSSPAAAIPLPEPIDTDTIPVVPKKQTPPMLPFIFLLFLLLGSLVLIPLWRRGKKRTGHNQNKQSRPK